MRLSSIFRDGIPTARRCLHWQKGVDMRRLTLLAVFVLAGCAAGGVDCGPDWRAIGERDGRINAGSQAERYASRCGGKVDTVAYDAGYAEGFSRRPPPNW
jgi:hypothetical protein